MTTAWSIVRYDRSTQSISELHPECDLEDENNLHAPIQSLSKQRR